MQVIFQNIVYVYNVEGLKNNPKIAFDETIYLYTNITMWIYLVIILHYTIYGTSLFVIRKRCASVRKTLVDYEIQISIADTD